MRCIITGFAAEKEEILPSIHILPSPQIIKLANAAVELKSVINAFCQDVGDNGFFQEILEEELSTYSIQVEFNRDLPEGIPESDFTPPEINPEESYLLQIYDRYCSIDALTAKGLYYGIVTFIQLIQAEISGEKLLPECIIFDYPTMAIRGVADDNSRGQVVTVESAKRYIREISRVKNNFFAIYIEDIFEFTNHPLIGVGRGRLNRAEVREICEYGAKFFVE
ncbi:MAG TPA: glycoside hydrolase family 20 zincin-like fold domain-containing protein, partial [Candidatus Lokiarchaeia archaeon]|nr:glycoside hydrolase family 20 zincin-like fold domain-containing protein [Candidatus Lokiarchaeia archaeon]